MCRPRLWLIVESSTDVRLVEGLAETHDLTVLARSITDGVEISQPPKIGVHVIRARPGRLAFAAEVFIRILRGADGADVVVVQGYALAAFAANLAGRMRRKAVVMLVCSPLEAYYLCRLNSSSPRRRFRRVEFLFLRVLARINARVGNRYVVLSEYLADVIRVHDGARPIHVCPVYGVDLDVYSASEQSRAEIRGQLGLPADVSLVFFSSRIAPEKDVETLLLAVRKLVRAGWKILLLNSSGGYQELAERAEELGIREAVVAQPPVDPRVDLASYYRAADLCVQASRAEGLGFAPLEALACCTPVVAADVGGLRETIIDGVTGWTYSPGNESQLAEAIAAALSNPTEARRRAERGRATVVDRFERNKVFRQFGSLISAHGFADAKQPRDSC